MDKLSGVSRFVSAPACLEQLPHEILQHILHYLPVKPARNTFRLINRNYMAGTEYLRVAGLVQARIRSKVATESQQKAESHVAVLINDCLNSAFPTALRHSLIIEVISLLPRLPAVSHAEAMRVVLAQCDMIGEQCGQATRKKCMAMCIHAYQRRTELEPALDRFRPANDDEALIAADYFVDDIDLSIVPFTNVINHLKSLLASMDMANTMNDSELSGRALIVMCDHCVDLFAVARGGIALRQSAGVEMLPAMKALLVEKSLQLLPGKSINCQAALVSVVLDLADRDSPTRKQAEKDGRKLVLKTPDAMLPANLMRLATSLFRKGVINTLIKRVEDWPEQGIKLAMLRQLVIVAWEKGAMEYMEHLGALISKLEPPDPVALQALLHANRKKSTGDQLEAAARDVIPYLFCVAPGLSRVAVVEPLNTLIFEYLMLTPQNFKKGLKAQVRSLKLLPYLLSSQARWLTTFYNSNEPQLQQLADAARSAARGAAGGAGAASAGLSTIPTTEAMMRMLKEFNVPGPNSRSDDNG